MRNLTYGIKYDPPKQALSVTHRPVSLPRPLERHTLVGFSRRAYGAHVEEGRWGDRSIMIPLYEYDEGIGRELTENAAEVQAAWEAHVVPLLKRHAEIVGRLTKVEKPAR